MALIYSGESFNDGNRDCEMTRAAQAAIFVVLYSPSIDDQPDISMRQANGAKVLVRCCGGIP
jgi:hypothetical protein